MFFFLYKHLYFPVYNLGNILSLYLNLHPKNNKEIK